jgi:hypothetical protein
MATKKPTTYFLISLMIAGLALSSLCLANAEAAIPKPSVPEFSLKIVDHSYDVPSSTTTKTDPYTGEKTVTIHHGYHIENKSVEIQTKNQPFKPYQEGATSIGLCYNISYKGHYEDTWKYYWCYDYDWFFWQSSSDYTTITPAPLLPAKGEVDFRVQAQIGYFINGTPVWPIERVYTFNGQVSGWSDTQTISSPTNVPLNATPTPEASTPNRTTSALPSQNPTVTSIQPTSGNPVLFGLDWAEIVMVALLAVIAVLLGLAVVYLRRKSIK